MLKRTPFDKIIIIYLNSEKRRNICLKYIILAQNHNDINNNDNNQGLK